MGGRVSRAAFLPSSPSYDQNGPCGLYTLDAEHRSVWVSCLPVSNAQLRHLSESPIHRVGCVVTLLGQPLNNTASKRFFQFKHLSAASLPPSSSSSSSPSSSSAQDAAPTLSTPASAPSDTAATQTDQQTSSPSSSSSSSPPLSSHTPYRPSYSQPAPFEWHDADPNLGDETLTNGIRFVWLPVPEGDIPTVAQLDSFIALTNHYACSGRSVLVHGFKDMALPMIMSAVHLRFTNQADPQALYNAIHRLGVVLTPAQRALLLAPDLSHFLLTATPHIYPAQFHNTLRTLAMLQHLAAEQVFCFDPQLAAEVYDARGTRVSEARANTLTRFSDAEARDILRHMCYQESDPVDSSPSTATSTAAGEEALPEDSGDTMTALLHQYRSELVDQLSSSANEQQLPIKEDVQDSMKMRVVDPPGELLFSLTDTHEQCVMLRPPYLLTFSKVRQPAFTLATAISEAHWLPDLIGSPKARQFHTRRPSSQGSNRSSHSSSSSSSASAFSFSRSCNDTNSGSERGLLTLRMLCPSQKTARVVGQYVLDSMPYTPQNASSDFIGYRGQPFVCAGDVCAWISGDRQDVLVLDLAQPFAPQRAARTGYRQFQSARGRATGARMSRRSAEHDREQQQETVRTLQVLTLPICKELASSIMVFAAAREDGADHPSIGPHCVELQKVPDACASVLNSPEMMARMVRAFERILANDSISDNRNDNSNDNSDVSDINMMVNTG